MGEEAGEPGGNPHAGEHADSTQRDPSWPVGLNLNTLAVKQQY